MAQQVYLGTSSGSIVVLDVHNGAVIAQIQMSEPSSSLSAGSVSSSASANGIRQLAWNCPRFKMEEPTSTASTTMSNGNGRQTGAPSTDGHLLSSLSGGGTLTSFLLVVVRIFLNHVFLFWLGGIFVYDSRGSTSRPGRPDCRWTSEFD